MNGCCAVALTQQNLNITGILPRHSVSWRMTCTCRQQNQVVHCPLPITSNASRPAELRLQVTNAKGHWSDIYVECKIKWTLLSHDTCKRWFSQAITACANPKPFGSVTFWTSELSPWTVKCQIWLRQTWALNSGRSEWLPTNSLVYCLSIICLWQHDHLYRESLSLSVASRQQEETSRDASIS